MTEFYDFDGMPVDLDWIERLFGRQEIYVTEPVPAYRLVELHACTSTSWVLEAVVLNESDKPVPGARVVLVPKVGADSITVETGADGLARFNLSGLTGILYSPVDDVGHWKVGLHPKTGPSDWHNTLGVVMKQNRWLNPVFQLSSESPEPPEPPEPPGPEPEPEPGTFEGDVLAYLDKITSLLEEIAASLKRTNALTVQVNALLRDGNAILEKIVDSAR